MATFGLGAGNLVEVKTVNASGSTNAFNQIVYTIPAGHYARVARVYLYTAGSSSQIGVALYDALNNSVSNSSISILKDSSDPKGVDPTEKFNEDNYFLDEGEGIFYRAVSVVARARVLLLIYKKP